MGAWVLRCAGMAGALLSDALLITAAGLGAGAVLMGSVFWFTLVKWLGVAYLAWIGLAMVFGRSKPAGDTAARSTCIHAGLPLFLRGFGVAVSNPKGLLFFSALLPQFVDPLSPLRPQLMAAALTCMAIDASLMLIYAALMLIYAALGSGSRRSLAWPGAAGPRRLCGAALCALAVSMAAIRSPGR